MTARFLWILAFAFLAGCGGVSVLPEPFTRERADGKIPVKTELIRNQVRAELSGTPEGEAEVARWQAIETDYNECRLSSARATKTEAEEVFAACMSRRGYVYMFPIDAEQFHNDIAFEEDEIYAAEKKAEEEARLAAEKRAEEERIAAAEKAERDRLEVNLFVAARDGNSSEVRRLLADGVNPNAAADNGTTALMFAAWKGHAEIAKILLSAGANPNAVNDNAKNEKGESITGMTTLMGVATLGHAEIAKILLSAGANPNAATDDGETALASAVQEGYAEIVKVLLSAGANPNAARDKGITALMTAATKEHAEIAKILLSAGANPNLATDDGYTALHLAEFGGHAEIVKMLLSAGANPNAAADNGETALASAVQEGYAEIVKVLLSAGANPNAADNDGFTALNSAVRAVHLDIAEILLEAKANPNHVIKDGISVMDNAIYDNHPEMLRLLRRYGGVCRKNCGLPGAENTAENIFENVWRSVVVIGAGDEQGSGVIVRPNVVATNCHVVDGGDIAVYKSDNRRAATDSALSATIRKRDDKRDFCLLNVAGLQGVAAKVRRYETLNVGESVYGLGAPQGLDLSLSSGIISQLRQGGGERFIQTDAAISPGSSGGGLFDSDGNLIGIMTFKIANENVEGIGFAIPADLVLGY